MRNPMILIWLFIPGSLFAATPLAHWPTAIEPSNGRYALAADRASHSSLTHIHWDEYASGENWLNKIMLHGMTDQIPAEVAAISRLWSHAAKVTGGGFYEPRERA